MRSPEQDDEEGESAALEQPSQQQQQQRTRPTKNIQSILPDHLDAIKEGSENSESTSAHNGNDDIQRIMAVAVVVEPKSPLASSSKLGSSTSRTGGSGIPTNERSSSPRKSSHRDGSSSSSSPNTSSPRRKMKPKSRSSSSAQPLEEEDDEDSAYSQHQQLTRMNGSSYSNNSRSRRRIANDESNSDNGRRGEGGENPHGTLDRVRATSATASDTGTSDTGDDDDASDVSMEAIETSGSPRNFKYSNSPSSKDRAGRKIEYSLQERLSALDPNSSAMIFDYDGEYDDDATGVGDMSVRSLPTIMPEDQAELTWRLDPSESMSDWTIRVYNRGTKITEEYHVHKNILAVGKRRSEYFVNLFRQLIKNSSSSNASFSNLSADLAVTDMAFPKRAASVVPLLLDYMYNNHEYAASASSSSSSSLQLTTDVAPGLRFLSQYFGVRTLFDRVMRFIQRDLNLKTMAAYYRASRELDDKKIANLVAKHCARNIHLIDTAHEIIQAIDPEFFLKVLSSPGLMDERKLHLSLLVTKYCQLHRDHLNSETFLSITHEQNLPVVHHTAAISLMGMEADLVVPTSIVEMSTTMTNLQERCIQGLAPHWRSLTEQDHEQTARVCRKLPSLVVTELLLRSLDCAKKEGDRQAQGAGLARNAKSPTQKGRAAAKATAAEGSKTKTEHEAALGALKTEYEDKLKHLQEVCYEKDKHIKNYYQELCKFERLPNSTEGKMMKSGSKEKPTVMPSIGKHSKEGYLLAGKKLGGAKYPMFYYKDGEQSPPS